MDIRSMRLIFILVLALCVIQGTNGELCTKHENAFPGKRLDGYTIREETSMTRRLCGKYCIARSSCMSINFNQLGLICQINSRTAGNESPLTSAEHWEYVNRTALVQELGDPCAGDPCPPGNICVTLTSGTRTCVQSKCGAPPHVVMMTTTASPTTHLGSSITYTCFRNHHYFDHHSPGNGTLLCMENGQWAPVNFRCFKLGCPTSSIYKDWSSSGISVSRVQCTRHNCKLIFTCNSNPSRTCCSSVCLSNGRWNSMGITC